MDENASSVAWRWESVGRQTLSQVDGSVDAHGLSFGLTRSFYNGFEMWWLAGMPMTLALVLTLLSFSLALGASSLGKSLYWSRLVPATVRQLVEWVSGPLRVGDGVVVEKMRTKGFTDATGMAMATTPGHIAVIMDGNRRYGKHKYGEGVKGHSDGSKTLVQFTGWCMDAGIQMLTVFAFSTENWNRGKAEVDALMQLFHQFMHEIVPEALKRGVRVRVLVSDGRNLPGYIVKVAEKIETETQHCTKFSLNLCVSYGARDEIVGACKKIAIEVINGETSVDDINEDLLSQRMLTAGLPDPDVLIRTSGELRISNFLLFQIAYSELIFIDKLWPEVTRDDVQDIVLEFSRRKRRFGK